MTKGKIQIFQFYLVAQKGPWLIAVKFSVLLCSDLTAFVSVLELSRMSKHGQNK